ncbi:hypothetical protein OT109_03155 [Phycisphaeraceae bacterium D3-23]
MGLLDRLIQLFGGSAPQRHPTSSDSPAEFPAWTAFHHPSIGHIYLEDEDGDHSMWLASEFRFQRYHEPIDANFDGDLAKPSSKSIKAYDWINANWPVSLQTIQDQAFNDFYKPYAANFKGVPEFESPDQLWGTETVLCLGITDRDNYEITLRFTWQKPKDDHAITFYIEDGRCVTHSVDG